MLACRATSEQLLLQVERFIARGRSADLYQIKLLQRLLPGGAKAQPAAAAPHHDKLQPGQFFAIKVAHCVETYPEAVKQAGPARAQLMSDEWQVLQQMSTSTHIINASMFGDVAPLQATAAAGAASGLEATAASTCTKQQQVQTSKPAAAAAPAGLPCLLMEYADGGSVRGMVYKHCCMRHAKPTPLSQEDTWCVVGAAVSALKDMHAAGYIHHDIKIDNMLAINTGAGVR
jgi:serine/threonine protein kinase